jgi:hypothetical protein
VAVAWAAGLSYINVARYPIVDLKATKQLNQGVRPPESVKVLISWESFTREYRRPLVRSETLTLGGRIQGAFLV